MYKELFIIIVILVTISGIEFITQNYSKKSIDDLSQKLSRLKDDLRTNKLTKIEFLEEYESIHSKWEEYNSKLSFYIEHSELEKVNTDFVTCRSLIESNELNLAISELEKAIFILEHIADKYSFTLANIF